jgi:hypothetical protein
MIAHAVVRFHLPLLNSTYSVFETGQFSFFEGRGGSGWRRMVEATTIFVGRIEGGLVFSG